MTSLYSLDIILVLFQCIIKQDYEKKYLVTGDWSQSTPNSHSIQHFSFFFVHSLSDKQETESDKLSEKWSKTYLKTIPPDKLGYPLSI